MSVKTDTIVRTSVLILALVNQILTSSGHTIIPVSDEELAELITLAATVAASVWAWWRNNSFTKDAIKADSFLDRLRALK